MTLLERTMKFSREDICYAGAAVLQLLSTAISLSSARHPISAPRRAAAT
jgi:hypothetical protein